MCVVEEGVVEGEEPVAESIHLTSYGCHRRPAVELLLLWHGVVRVCMQ